MKRIGCQTEVPNRLREATGGLAPMVSAAAVPMMGAMHLRKREPAPQHD
jgi:hypothetical protein